MGVRSLVGGILSDLRNSRSKARRRVDEIFSREVLGSILVSLSMGKVVEAALAIVAPGAVAKLVGWLVLSVTFVLVFAYWERVARAAKQAAEDASEKVEEASDSGEAE